VVFGSDFLVGWIAKEGFTFSLIVQRQNITTWLIVGGNLAGMLTLWLLARAYSYYFITIGRRWRWGRVSKFQGFKVSRLEARTRANSRRVEGAAGTSQCWNIGNSAPRVVKNKDCTCLCNELLSTASCVI